MRDRHPHRGPETSEFRHVFHTETDRLMRRRLVWFISLWGGLGLLGAIGTVALAISNGGLTWMGLSTAWKQALYLALGLAWLFAYAAALALVLGRRLPSRRIVQISIALIVLDGLFFLTARAVDIPGYNLAWFWVSHLLACIIFPWRVNEALLPIAIVIPLSIASALLIERHDPIAVAVATVFLLLSMTPAIGLCGYKHSQRLVRASNRFLNQRYGMLRQELAYARQIHEALFPQPLSTGPLRFSYKYEPMRQIGGDYLHAYRSPPRHDAPARFSVVLLDVTGHGIPAALTVNRLHGELDLRFADDPDISPGAVLHRLNRYINLTLARHSIYATAICVRIDEDRGTIEYASGGHPPAFLLSADHTIRELGSTALVLGACRSEEYEPAQVSLAFHPGDSLILYTDGAVEARAPDGRMLRITGLRDALLEAAHAKVRPGLYPDHLLTVVAAHRRGAAPEDDTLFVELHRPLASHLDPDHQVDPNHDPGRLASAPRAAPAPGL